jgi:hypothetical protein
MSIIQQHTAASLSDAWRTINIDALTEDSSLNFDTSTLHPPLPEISEAEVRQLAGQVRQLLRGGDTEGALRGCLESPVYNGNDLAKVGATIHRRTLLENEYEETGRTSRVRDEEREADALYNRRLFRRHIFRQLSRSSNPSRRAI